MVSEKHCFERKGSGNLDKKHEWALMEESYNQGLPAKPQTLGTTARHCWLDLYERVVSQVLKSWGREGLCHKLGWPDLVFSAEPSGIDDFMFCVWGADRSCRILCPRAFAQKAGICAHSTGHNSLDTAFVQSCSVLFWKSGPAIVQWRTCGRCRQTVALGQTWPASCFHKWILLEHSYARCLRISVAAFTLQVK